MGARRPALWPGPGSGRGRLHGPRRRCAAPPNPKCPREAPSPANPANPPPAAPNQTPKRLLELTGAKEPAALERLVKSVGAKPEAVNKDLLLYKGILSKLAAAKVRAAWGGLRAGRLAAAAAAARGGVVWWW